MKYPNWDEYSWEKKWDALRAEISLETHNGTTKQDLINIMYFQNDVLIGLQNEVSSLNGTIENISQWAQDNGYEEVSKAIDCEFEL